MEKEKIINGYIKTYLVGAMEKTGNKDDGRGWRDKIRPELEKRIDSDNNAIYVFDPTINEEEKIGFPTKEFHKKLEGWVASGNRDLVREKMNIIWRGKSYLVRNKDTGEEELKHILGDIDYVRNSDFLILHIHEKDRPCVAKGSKVLMADWSNKNIEDVNEGDIVLGFQKNKGITKLVKSKVLQSVKNGCMICIETVDENMNKIHTTKNHEFLTPNNKYGSIYEPIHKLSQVFSVPFIKQDINFLKGWITGYLQNDGCFTETWKKHQISALSDKKAEIDIVKNILEELKFTPNFRTVKKDDNVYYEISINKFNEYVLLKDWKNNHRPNKKFQLGWLSGAIDADGYYEKESIRYTQSLKNEENINIFEKYCTNLNINYNYQLRDKRDIYIGKRKIKNSSKECTICVSKIVAFKIPSKLKYKQDKYTLSLHGLRNNIKKKKSYRQDVYDLTTSTGNFIANGFIVSNCGTYAEAFLAFERKIPIYMIQTMPLSNYNKSLLGWVLGSNGEIFPNQKQLLEFIDKKYKLKVLKNNAV